MSNEKDLLLRVQNTRERLDAIEKEWKLLRLQSRHYALELWFVHNYSINRISELTGHMRPTLRVWIDRSLAANEYPDSPRARGESEGIKHA